jgi:hypothetical protein
MPGTVRSVLSPDTKNWTWVIDRICPECGFDASTCRTSAVPGLIRTNALAWRTLLAQGAIGPDRPDAEAWSSLEYACHVRDVLERYDGRVVLMLTEHDPLYQNWDQDASAVDERYEEQDPSTVVAQLSQGAAILAGRLDEMTESEWQRPGRRSDGAIFTIDSISRYMMHDLMHHIWDVTRAVEG